MPGKSYEEELLPKKLMEKELLEKELLEKEMLEDLRPRLSKVQILAACHCEFYGNPICAEIADHKCTQTTGFVQCSTADDGHTPTEQAALIRSCLKKACSSDAGQM